jgi:hypothetical protein
MHGQRTVALGHCDFYLCLGLEGVGQFWSGGVLRGSERDEGEENGEGRGAGGGREGDEGQGSRARGGKKVINNRKKSYKVQIIEITE